MKIKQIGAAAFGAAVVTSFATLASAQTHPAAAAPNFPTGAPIAGVCVLSNEGVVYGSTVGKFMISRLQQLSAQVDAELNGEQTQLQTDAKALEAQRGKIPDAQFQQQGAAIQQRAGLLQRKAQLRQREVSATQEKALQRIGTEAEPIVRQTFQQRSCSLLFSQSALVYPAPAMDITPAVIQGLNAKIQQFPFDREHLDQQTGAPAR
jgi:Skp family chaperone for outer membrane proteins